jgi:hypothetical protein
MDAGLDSFMHFSLFFTNRKSLYQLAKSWCNNSQRLHYGTDTQSAKPANRTGGKNDTV